MSKDTICSLIIIPLTFYIGLCFNGMYEKQTAALCGAVSFLSISSHLARPYFREIFRKWIRS